MGHPSVTPHSRVQATPYAGTALEHSHAVTMRTSGSAASPTRQDFSGSSRPIARFGFDELYPTGPRTAQRTSHEFPFAFPGAVEITPIGELYCAAGILDSHGRVSNRSALKYLAWDAGQRIGFDGDDQVIVIRCSRRSRWSVGRSGYLFIPAALRHRCNLDPGVRVLLAASQDNDLLVVLPPAVVAAALWAYRPQTWHKPA